MGKKARRLPLQHCLVLVYLVRQVAVDANSDIIKTVLGIVFQMHKCVLPDKRRMLPVSVFLLLGLARQVKRETLLVIVFQLKLMGALQGRERTPLAYVLI